MITLQDVLAVDGGRRYLEDLYSDSRESFEDPRRKFKAEPEKTASASVYLDDGVWYMTDFGGNGDGKRRNAVNQCMFEKGVEFKDAIKEVAAFYDLDEKASNSNLPKASFNQWVAKPDEGEKTYKVKYKELEEHEALAIISKYAWQALSKDPKKRLARAAEILTFQHLKVVSSYTYTKDGQTYEYTSNETFPIFSIVEEGFEKLYKPKDEKKYRFSYVGEKPKSFLHGFQQLKDFVIATRAAKVKDLDGDKESASYVSKVSDAEKWRLDSAILCTGGSDALNVKCLDYFTIWLNSESQMLSPQDYKELKKYVKDIYQIGDIDATGIKKTHEKAMMYLQMKTIELPADMVSKNPKNKDVRDYLNYYSKWDFDQLYETALPYQFWQYGLKKNKDGEQVYKYGVPVVEYSFKNLRAYNFLQKNGFARFESAKEKLGFFFIKIDGPLVKRVFANDLKNYINDFLASIYQPEDLRDMVYKTPQLSENSLSNLQYKELDFRSAGEDFQNMFFSRWNSYKAAYDNTVWKVTSKGIEETKGISDRFVWQEKVLEAKPRIKDAFWKIIETDGKPDIELLPEPLQGKTGNLTNKDCPEWLCFLVQTSRTHWRKELEERLGIMSRLTTTKEREAYIAKHEIDEKTAELIFHKDNVEGSDFVAAYKEKHRFNINGPMLTPEEQKEQRGHLLNKIYVIGYGMHRHKFENRPWGIWLMDGKISLNGQSHGGSGKSLFSSGFRNCGKTVVPLPGRRTDLFKNQFLYENVDQATDMVFFDDIHEYFDIGNVYTELTDAWSVNVKNGRQFTMSFMESPKILFSGNYGDRDVSPSTLRRKIYCVVCDFYHPEHSDYKSGFTPSEDFGHNLFSGWTPQEWELYYNVMARCCQFYLSRNERMDPPMDNITKRNLMASIGSLLSWADGYFHSDSDRLDTYVRKDFAMKDYCNEQGLKSISSQKFMAKMTDWAELRGYTFNPEEVCNSADGTIIRKVKYNDHAGMERQTTKAHIYVQSNRTDTTTEVQGTLDF